MELQLIVKIVEAAIRCVKRYGKKERFRGPSGSTRYVTIDRLQIAFQTPKAMAHGSGNYAVNIWYDNEKVFSVCWNSTRLENHETVYSTSGPWVPFLFEVALQ
jgi:hypothetical protein